MYWSLLLSTGRGVNDVSDRLPLYVRRKRLSETYWTTHPWFSSITFELDSSPGSRKFHSALLSDQQFLDVANAKAGSRVANMFAPPSQWRKPHPRGRNNRRRETHNRERCTSEIGPMRPLSMSAIPSLLEHDRTSRRHRGIDVHEPQRPSKAKSRASESRISPRLFLTHKIVCSLSMSCQAGHAKRQHSHRRQANVLSSHK